MMDANEISRAVAEFSKSYGNDRYPAAFLADYEPVECLGAGLWSETLLVKNRRTGEPAVAKYYPAQTLGKVCEGELLKRLHHQALPAFLAEYRSEAAVCVVRAYVEGVTLAEAARRRDFTHEEIVGFGCQMCDILRYLHAQQPSVIHRDIKPENLILRPDGQLVLIDFGISRVFDKGAKTDTQSLGTLSFAPPEQYGFSQTDCRSDIFSLGMVLGFLLTKSTDLTAIRSGVPDRGLSRIVNRCTAFSPKDRYHSAAQVERALRAQSPKRRKRALLLTAACAALLVAAGVLGAVRYASGVRFAEPMIGRAVRAALGKGATERVTQEDLLLVEGLYIFGDTVAADADGFYEAASAWYAAGDWQHAGIADLSDVRRMKNLRELCLAAQQIDDLSPIAELDQLEKLECKHNGISDISVLSGLPKLSAVGLNDNPVSDLSPLGGCKSLCSLDLCDVQGYDPSFLLALSDFTFLDLANPTDSYAYLGNRKVTQLKLGYTDLDSLACLAGVTGLQSLELKHSRLTSLDGLEAHSGLTALNIAGCAIDDLSPLLALPRLKELTVSEDMLPALEKLGPHSFSVTLE